jgi:hypothetical protein
MVNGRFGVFVCYSHDDEAWLKEVEVYLAPLIREQEVDLWVDTRIKSGERWRDEIRDALSRASIAVLLISGPFYASEFIAEDELPPLLQAEEKRGLVILGVHVGYSLFDLDQRFRDFQSVNSPERPLVSLSEGEQQEVLVKLARRIHELAQPPNP